VRAPPILLLDELTSGLDSTAAFNIVQHLKGVCTKGHVMSIHQASSKAYALFDKLYLLSQGRQIYFGPGGESAVDHFGAQGYKVPLHTNPAKFFLDTISTDFGKGTGGDKLAELENGYVASAVAASLKPKCMPSEGPLTSRRWARRSLGWQAHASNSSCCCTAC